MNGGYYWMILKISHCLGIEDRGQMEIGVDHNDETSGGCDVVVTRRVTGPVGYGRR